MGLPQLHQQHSAPVRALGQNNEDHEDRRRPPLALGKAEGLSSTVPD